ncbi:MAG: hypothetical protein Q7V58_13120 [Actinomycetota bacterium]|nr:hypothetical protein [Actinomycetota bacterium]
MGRTRHLRLGAVVAVSSTLLASGVVGAPWSAAATGDVREFAFGDAAMQPHSIAADADGALWITLRGGARLAKSSLDGTLATILSGGSPSTGPAGIALGPDQRMWFAEETANRITAVTTSTGAAVGYDLPKAGSQPRSITAGPDGALWFTEFAGNRIGRITTAGVVTEFDLAAGAGPDSITSGPDGALWFTLRSANAIGRITTAGTIATYPLPATDSAPAGIAAGPDGNLWFTESLGNRIGRISPAGLISEFGLPTAGSNPAQIVTGPDRNLWFTEPGTNKVSRITVSGVITQYPVPTPGSTPTGITAGADGNIWFTETAGNRIGRVLTGVVPTSTSVPLITSSGTKVGQPLTASAGSWSGRPSSYTYQWQRCATADTPSCADIAGATAATYAIVAADASQRLRVLVRATNLNGTATTPGASALLPIDGLPAVPVPPAVSGGQVVTVATGVTATLRSPVRVRRGAVRTYAVRFNSTAVLGTVRIVLVNSAGQQVRVVAAGKRINRNGVARRMWRLPYGVLPGAYTVTAVFTPRAEQSTAYAVATLTKTITVRR